MFFFVFSKWVCTTSTARWSRLIGHLPVYFSNSSIPKSPLCPTFLFHSSFLFISYTFRLLHQSPSSAAASYATGASSPPPWLFYTNRGACSWGRPSPGGPSFCDCCCSYGCERGGGPSWRRPDHPNSVCEAHPPTAKLHQPFTATTHGDHRSQGVHLHAATVQWVQLHNLYNVTSDTWYIGTWQRDEINIK